MNIPSTLDAVTVFAKGALCTRIAKLKGTDQQVRVTGLPLSMQPGSLRARVTGGTARVLDVRPSYDVELAAETDLSAEQKALEAAVAEVARLQGVAARVERELAELAKLRPIFPSTKAGEPPRTAPVEAMLKAAEFVSEELSKRFEARRALSVQLEDAQNELTLRRQRVEEASAAVRTKRARLARAAVITLSEGAGDVELAVEYFVPGARWAPSYALKLEPGMAAGVLTMRAAVAQASGEDWSQVKLSLSTAALDRRTALPELKSLRIGRAQPAPARSGWREPPPGLDELFAGFDSTWARRPMPPAAPPVVAATIDVLAAKPSRKRARREAVAEVAFEEDLSESEGESDGESAAAMSEAPTPPPPRSMPMAPPASGMAPPAPMMASQSMPRMSRDRAMPAAKRSSGILGALGGFGGGGGARRSSGHAEPYELRESAVMSGEEVDDEWLGEETRSVQLAEPQVELGGNLLDYGSLYMAAPGQGRGRLQSAPDEGIVFLASFQLQVSMLLAVVTSSERRAAQVEHLALPPRAVAPWGGSFDYRYDCSARVDLPSHGEWTTVPVSEADVGLVAEYACVPSLEPQVYRTLKLHNRSKHALLRGPVDVTLGDEFLLTADLPHIAPGAQDARLGLGVEEAIKVARKTHFKESTGGLLGGSTVLPHDVEIELNNRLAFPARVEVRERVPVSLDDDVKVEEAKVDPPWEKDEGLRDGAVVRGARAWRVTVPPGQKLTLAAQYVVRIPSDKMVVGGNRRS